MVVAMGTGLVVLAMIQLMLILSLYNLVARVDIPSSRLLVPLQTLAPFLCLGTIPLIGQVPSSIVPPWNRTGTDTESLQPEQPKLKGWNLIAQAVDRLSFVVYLVVVFLFLVSYIGAAASSYNNKIQNGVLEA